MNRQVSQKMRIYHRYLGFFLVGVMAIYSLSGIMMIFRNTDTFKITKHVETVLEKGLNAEQLGEALRIRGLQVTEQQGAVLVFDQGTYNAATGETEYDQKKLPTILEKLEHMHKATTDSPLFFLNIFFGFSLFFFVLSSFWMFMPGTTPFKKGMYFVLGGVVLALLMVLI